jgi:hypothetical protein
MTVVLNDPATLADLVRFGPVPHELLVQPAHKAAQRALWAIRAERLTELPAKQIVHWWPQ